MVSNEPPPRGAFEEPPPARAPGAEDAAPGKETELPAPPAHLPPLPPVPGNPTTEAGFALGRRLFYDGRLSRTGAVSCASCHDPSHAFSIPEALPTRGVSGVALERHAPSLINLAWATTGLFWDGGAKNLESLSLAPLTHADEMGRADLEGMMRDVEADPAYPPMFREAFDEAVSISALLRALAQFQRGIYAANAPWDRAVRGEPIAFTADEALGAGVFARSCARCHTPGLFTDAGYHNNGLDEAFGEPGEDARRGRARITFAAEDVGKFKTPTLRNVELSAPYMHDGRLPTLASVIEHYRGGMRESPSLDPGFRRDGRGPGVDLTDAEARALVAFLGTLTDATLATDRRYVNPFRETGGGASP